MARGDASVQAQWPIRRSKKQPRSQKAPRGTKGPSNQNPLKTPEFYPLKTTQSFCTRRVFAPLLVQKVVQMVVQFAPPFAPFFGKSGAKTGMFGAKNRCKNKGFCTILVQKHGAKTNVFASGPWCKNLGFCTTFWAPNNHVLASQCWFQNQYVYI